MLTPPRIRRHAPLHPRSKILRAPLISTLILGECLNLNEVFKVTSKCEVTGKINKLIPDPSILDVQICDITSYLWVKPGSHR